jgi:Zn-dependent membrane protease YugP
MTKGGWIVVGTTALLAAMDGALLATLAAADVGVAMFAVLCRKATAPGELNAKRREEELRSMILACKSKEMRKEMEKAVEADLTELKKARELGQHGAREVSKIAAIGVFACPAISVALLAQLLLAHKQVQSQT